VLRKLIVCAPLAAVIVLCGLDLAGAQERVRHPRLHAALYELVHARKELNDAGGGFGGHRKQALSAMDDAIKSVRLVLEVKGDNPNVMVRKSDFYRKFKGYPHLRQVLVDLREAKSELEDAKSDFRGNKERAIRDINVAIKQVKAAMDFADK